tara:strand:- start:2 stop:184 length:183 start_codon:yes stop_codon:yes gene_type:complete
MYTFVVSYAAMVTAFVIAGLTIRFAAVIAPTATVTMPNSLAAIAGICVIAAVIAYNLTII